MTIIPSRSFADLSSLKHTVEELSLFRKSSPEKNRAVQSAAARTLEGLTGTGSPPSAEQEYQFISDYEHLSEKFNTLKIYGAFKRIFCVSQTQTSIQKVLDRVRPEYERLIHSPAKIRAYCYEKYGLGALLDMTDLTTSDLTTLLTTHGLLLSEVAKFIPSYEASCCHEESRLQFERSIYPEYTPYKDVPAIAFFKKAIESCALPSDAAYLMKELEKYVKYRIEKLQTSGKITPELATALLTPRAEHSEFESLLLNCIETSFPSRPTKYAMVQLMLGVLENCPSHLAPYFTSNLKKAYLPIPKPEWSQREFREGICAGRSRLAVASSITHSSRDERKARFLQASISLNYRYVRNRVLFIKEADRLLPDFSNIDSLDPSLCQKWALNLGFIKKEGDSDVGDVDQLKAQIALMHTDKSSSEKIEYFKVILGSISNKMKTVSEDEATKGELVLEEWKLNERLKLIEKNKSPSYSAPNFDYLFGALYGDVTSYIVHLTGSLDSATVAHDISVIIEPPTATSPKKFILLDPNNRDSTTGDPRTIEFKDETTLVLGLTLLVTLYKNAGMSITSYSYSSFEKTTRSQEEWRAILKKAAFLDDKVEATIMDAIKSESDVTEIETRAQKLLLEKLALLTPTEKKKIEEAIVRIYGIDPKPVFEFPLFHLDILKIAFERKEGLSGILTTEEKSAPLVTFTPPPIPESPTPFIPTTDYFPPYYPSLWGTYDNPFSFGDSYAYQTGWEAFGSSWNTEVATVESG